jgi:D-psicose/D-tagatose/L-ribulose 3-epimerase
MASNPLGIHALVWVGGWTPEEAELAISSTARAGYDLIEIPALDPSRINVTSTREMLERHGLQASVTIGLAPDTDINSQDVACIDRGRDILMRALEVSSGIGSTYLGGVIFGAMMKYSAPTTERARANSIAVIMELAQEARGCGTTIGLEFVNRYESNLLNTAQQTLDYLDLVGEDNVVVHADVYHMNIEETDFRTPILACGDRLGYVHVGESHRGYLGTGSVNFPEFFGALKEVGYAGPITFESFSSSVVDPLLSNTLAIWRNLWSDSTDLATQAHAFISAGLADE